MRRYDAVTFDMGYTLIYFHPPEIEVLLSAYHSLGLRPPLEALRQAQDLAWQEYRANAACATFEPSPQRDREIDEGLARRTLEHLGLYREGLVAPLVAAVKAAFSAPGVIRPYPEVIQVLQTLRARGLRLGIVSNWSWDLEDHARRAGLSGYFDVIVASARAGCDKPHPAIFQRALRALGCRPERALHIGDSYEADVAGALGVGMQALWLDRDGRGGHPEPRSIRDLSEALPVVLDGPTGRRSEP